MQVSFEVSVFRALQSPVEGDPRNDSRNFVKTIFNGQTQEIELDADSDLVACIRPEKSTLLEENQEDMIVSVPKGTKLFIRGIVSQDRKHIRLIALDGTKQIEEKRFHAKPVSTEDVLKKYAVGDLVTVSVADEKAFISFHKDREPLVIPSFTITCRVTEILENGKLNLDGMSNVRIGEVDDTVFVSGIVAPTAIRDGKVESQKLENMTIKIVPVSAHNPLM